MCGGNQVKKRWLIALGSNVAGGETALRQGWRAAVALLPLHEGRLSSVSLSEPAEGAHGNRFANAVGVGYVDLDPLEGLAVLQRIEKAFGRDRDIEGFHGARPLDLDLIDVDGVALALPRLTLPHPRWKSRAFVLGPLAEVCPEFLALHAQELNWAALHKGAA